MLQLGPGTAKQRNKYFKIVKLKTKNDNKWEMAMY